MCPRGCRAAGGDHPRSGPDCDQPAKQPYLRTRAKIRWDDDFVYIAGEMEEPDVFANMTVHDTVVCDDNDFEVFAGLSHKLSLQAKSYLIF